MPEPVFHKAPETVLAAWLLPEHRPEPWRHSSGGFFRVLARYTLNNGGIVYGAAFDRDFRLSHRGAETEEDCRAFYGSKYLQSDTADAYQGVQDALDKGRSVLYSGTPCQVAGLYAFLGGDREGLLTADLVCSGAPSPEVFKAYLNHVRGGKTVASISFRDQNWKTPVFSVRFTDGSVFSQPFYQTPFGRGFGMRLTMRPCCGICPFARPERVSDFTLGDFWGYSGLTPERGGVSLVLRNSEKAAGLQLPPLVHSIEKPLSDAVAKNPRLIRPAALHKGREAFFKDFETLPFETVVSKWLARPSLLRRVMAKLLPERVKKILRRGS